jgi:hypothetical protein
MDLVRRYVDSFGELVCGQAKWRKELLAKDFSRMGPHTGHDPLTVGDLNVRWSLIGPPKVDSKLSVGQLVLIATHGSHPNVTELGRRIEHVELALGHILEVSPSCRANAVHEERFDARFRKASDHGT